MEKKKSNNARRDFLSKALKIGFVGGSVFSATGFAMGRDRLSQTVELTDEQKDTIFFMYQEEKVARDVYITLGEVYPEERTFAYIQKSEQRHIDAVEELCDRYGIDKKGVNEESVGNFVLPELQDLYDECVEAGMVSLYDALKVGENIELTDIEDLEKASVGMPDDVVNVFMNLKEGSLDHLEAFQNALEGI